MKQITYAGESVLTSDDVGTALVELTAALARKGLADAVVIPICDASGEDCRTAELVIGQGNDVLAVPVDSASPEPDFSREAQELRQQHDSLIGPRRTSVGVPVAAEPDADDFDYELDLAP